ncbi:hypothetical protein ACFPIJ_55875 [Dactylosporangium cerinum]|uniref:Uncharacterized protein n=1 Tax=Dactylosporangium cerinum TaxID=1434730 RepID=A0ABV9WIK5_9ACTN
MTNTLTRLAAAAGVGLMLVAVAGVTADQTTGAGSPPLPAGRGTTPSALTAPAGGTPQGGLLEIAQHAQPAASDHQAGAASCIRLVRWDRTPGRRVIETTSSRQVNPDGSGLLWQQRGSDPDAVPTVTQYAAGSLYGPVGESIPADPVRLADVVAAVAPAGSGPTAVVAVLLDLASVRTLDLAQRAAVVRVLAMLPGVTFPGQSPRHDSGVFEFEFSDGGGDPISVDIDPDTAEILGYQVGGRTALQSSTTTLIRRRARCACPSPPGTLFLAAALRTDLPPLAGCTVRPGVVLFHPADLSQGSQR